jgi:hypothetical protein
MTAFSSIVKIPRRLCRRSFLIFHPSRVPVNIYADWHPASFIVKSVPGIDKRRRLRLTSTALKKGQASG